MNHSAFVVNIRECVLGFIVAWVGGNSPTSWHGRVHGLEQWSVMIQVLVSQHYTCCLGNPKLFVSCCFQKMDAFISTCFERGLLAFQHMTIEITIRILILIILIVLIWKSDTSGLIGFDDDREYNGHYCSWLFRFFVFLSSVFWHSCHSHSISSY